LKNHADISLVRDNENSIARIEDRSSAQENFAAQRPL